MYARTPSNAQHLLTLQEFKAATADLPDDHDHLPVLVEAEIRLLQPLLAGLQDALDRRTERRTSVPSLRTFVQLDWQDLEDVGRPQLAQLAAC